MPGEAEGNPGATATLTRKETKTPQAPPRPENPPQGEDLIEPEQSEGIITNNAAEEIVSDTSETSKDHQETSPEPAPEAQPPSETQQAVETEVSRETLGREIEIEATSLLHRRYNETSDSALQDTNSRKLGILIDAPRKPNGQSMNFTSPLIIRREDNVFEIYGVTGKDKNDLTCYTEKDPKKREAGKGLTFSRKEVADAILLSEADSILQLYSDPKEREVIQTHINILRTNLERGLTGDPQHINQLLRDVADQNGITTVDHLTPFLEAQVSDPARRQEILALMSGHNLITSEVMARIFQNANLDELITQQGAEIQILTVQANNSPKDKELQMTLAVAKEYLTLFKNASETLQEGNVPQRYFDMVKFGQIDIETARSLNNALKSGDLENVVSTIISETDDTGTPKERAEKKLKREEAIRQAKRIGGMGLIALLLMAMVGSGLAKQATS